MDMSLWGTFFNPRWVTRADSTPKPAGMSLSVLGGTQLWTSHAVSPGLSVPIWKAETIYSHFLIELS